MKMKPYVEQIKARNYELPEIIQPSTEMIELKDLIDSTNTSKIVPKRKKIKYVLQGSRDFLDSHFKLKDIPFAPHFDRIKIGSTIYKRYGTVHPYGLPIHRKLNEVPFFGCLRELMYTQDGQITEYYYKAIELAFKLNELSSLSYTHELTHTQLGHVKGLINNYSNTEFLSIFLETLQAYETSEKLLRIHDSERLSELAGIIKELEKFYNTEDENIKSILVEGSAYAESTIKAYKLFVRYINSTPKIQKEILQGIQNVFNENISVEDFLLSQDLPSESIMNTTEIINYLRK